VQGGDTMGVVASLGGCGGGYIGSSGVTRGGGV